MPGLDRRLPVQRLVIGELGHQNLCQQARAGNAAFDRPAWRCRLRDMVAACTGFLAPDMANHFEGAVDDFKLLRDILAKRFEFAATFATGCLAGFKNALFAWKVFRQWLAFRFAPR